MSATQPGTPDGPSLCESASSEFALVNGLRLHYIGGDFTEVNAKPQPGFVKFPASR